MDSETEKPKASKRYPYSIRVRFGGVPGLEPFEGTMRISGATDSFYLSADGLLIRYERSKKQGVDQAFNSVRVALIKELWVLFYAVTGKFSDIGEITYEYPGGTKAVGAASVGLADCPRCEDPRLLTSGAASELYVSAKRTAMIASLSYVYASRRAKDPMSRFRYLWSAFNCLYKGYPCASGSAEYLRANALISALPPGPALLGIKRDFHDKAPSIDAACWRWNDCLKGFRPFKVTQNGGVSSVDKKAATVLSDADEALIHVLRSRAAYAKWNDVPRDKNPIVQRLLAIKAGASSDRFLFVFSSYLYWLRCDSMHGNSPYPVFMDKDQRGLLNLLCDTLEALLPLCISQLCKQAEGAVGDI